MTSHPPPSVTVSQYAVAESSNAIYSRVVGTMGPRGHRPPNILTGGALPL